MKNLLTYTTLAIALSCAASPIVAANQFTATADRATVSPAPTGGTPLTAMATAEFDLVSLGAGEFALDYEITIVGLDTATFRPGATGFDTVDTQDNLAAIHMHFVPAGSVDNRGTPHVMNILGAPLTAANGIAESIEDDLVVDQFDLNSLTTVLSGRWDAADVTQTAGLAEGPRTKPVADFVDELRNGEIFLMLHTTGDPAGAIGGFLVPVPEPTALALTACAVLASFGGRRKLVANR